MISRIHLRPANAYKLMCFDRNINENRDVKFLECDYLLVQWCVKLTLAVLMQWYIRFFPGSSRAELQCNVHVALPKRPINLFILVQQ
jgi:hypothetical protein